MNDLHTTPSFKALDEGRLQPVDKGAVVVTKQDAIGFLEGACRNWVRVPGLSAADVEDVRVELYRFLTRHQSETGAALPSDGREAGEETAWLVEFLPSGDSYRSGKRFGPACATSYYCGVLTDARRMKTRTEDPNSAMRFSRKQDAEEMIMILNNNDYGPVNAIATEHKWLAALAQPVEAGEDGT